jgi:formylglycine-generating enzyme required for sulfatase activity
MMALRAAVAHVFAAAVIVGFAGSRAEVRSQANPQSVTLETLLERAGAYFLAFEQRFSNVVTEERYAQDAIARPASTDVAIVTPRGGLGGPAVPPPLNQHRELVSDFLLVKLPSENRWLPFRDVFEVDHRRVRDREERLSRLFLKPAATAIEQAGRIMEESARYNVGNIQRTMNLPVFALEVLRPSTQHRFGFSKGKLDTSVGPATIIVEFKEQLPPTLIRGEFGRELFSRGRFWIDEPTGRVLKSELVIDDVRVRAQVTTRYQVDPVYDLAVPVDMKEEYKLPAGARITGSATYGHFRSFDVRVTDDVLKPPTTITETITGMTLVEVQAGRFMMGSPASEVGRGDDELSHEVTIGKPFLLGQFEVTQEQWRTVMGTSPSQFGSCGTTCPVERVSYDQIQEFLATLNSRASGVRFRLPTEAEWEYACRGATTTPFSTGDNITTSQANYNGLRPYTSSPPGVFREGPTPASTFDANLWGFGDMHGNVREWTADWYGGYPAQPARDPHGPPSGTRRVVRGGSWNSEARSLRCAARDSQPPKDADPSIGFRVAGEREMTRSPK